MTLDMDWINPDYKAELARHAQKAADKISERYSLNGDTP